MPYLINFSHPLSEEVKQQIFQSVQGLEVRTVAVQVNHSLSLAQQISEIVGNIGLHREQWIDALYVIMPGYAPAAAVLMAAIAGRHGRLPRLVALRPAPGVTPTRYELGEIIDLESLKQQISLYDKACNDGREDANDHYSEFTASNNRDYVAWLCEDKVREVARFGDAEEYKKGYISGYMERTAQLEQERPKKIN